jgi:hypothetical protein
VLINRQSAVWSLVAVLAAMAVMIGTDDSHHTNVRYLAWRQFGIGSWEYGLRYLNVDPEFRRSFEGKPRDRLRHWFPVLLAGTSRSFPICPGDPAVANMESHGEWIGDSPWLVLYEGETIREIRMVKGC